jgi:hypothetical protein
MMQHDYILRLIEQLGQVLTVVLRLKKEERYEDALAVIDETLRRHVGFTLAETEALSADDLVALVRLTRSKGMDNAVIADKLTALAILLREEAEIYTAQHDLERGDDRRLKALQVYLAVLAEEDPGSTHTAAAIEPLVAQLAAYDLPARAKDQLWQFYDRSGQFSKAEDWLFELLEDEQASPDTVARGVDFYERLCRMSDDELLAGDLPREEVLAGLLQLQALQGQ